MKTAMERPLAVVIFPGRPAGGAWTTWYDWAGRPAQEEYADGTGARQVTRLGGANFAPFFHPDGKRIIFSSNYADPRSGHFDLYIINLDGTGLERVTTHPEFDSFPMWSPDGRKLLWVSNRNGRNPGETNIFIADWLEKP